VRTAAHDGSGTKTTVKPGSRRQIHYNGENVIRIQFEISLNSDNENYSDFCFNTGW
jgi:hypothetical protein